MDEQFDFSVVDEILAELGCEERAIIAILQSIQEHYRYLPREVFPYLAERLHVSQARIYSVATFYETFSLEPKGKFVIKVCDGTACHVKGSGKALDMVTKTLKIQPGETTRDKMFSLEIVACMGACGLAPVVNINGQFYAKVSPMKLQRIIDECREKEQTHANA